eukprot:CAMPEP_0114612598 /NCGR_PEP_ID=MMETSP0168-20121206/4703_1 /TAXON_ID=95228 ORGANISM="Vannella sp., Strain DIVA3 517/6/12" /NCGR_SAMPLE_ID=MMETSP0168 /ASSEMBLY_ACC=CAM_ASM_000044 /LENGTH=90 /DNA_ID=CAMNT_0001823585 /DNA_START=56 /DNA_END=328 /DNA_ORIENTATION=+
MAAASTEGLVSLLRYSAFGGGILFGYGKYGHVVNSKRAALASFVETKEEELKAKDSQIAALNKQIHRLENPDFVEEEAPSFWEAIFGKRE